MSSAEVRSSAESSAAVPPTPRGEVTTYHLSAARVIRAEWIKQRTLRSTWIGLGALVALLVVVSAIACGVSTGSVTQPGNGPAADPSDPLTTALTGANIGVLLVGVLGCLAGAREYGSRMIAATVGAVPHRGHVVGAKATAFVAAFLPTAVVAVLAAFGLGMAVLAAGDAETVALGDEGVVRSLVGMACYLTAIGLLGLGLGVVLRSVASSIGVLLGAVLVVPGIAGALLPDSWNNVLQYLPTNAAGAVTALGNGSDTTLGAWAGAAVLAGWVGLTLGAAVATITRRDV